MPTWFPLESNPELLSKYVTDLGAGGGLRVEEVLALEDWALDMVPQPASMSSGGAAREARGGDATLTRRCGGARGEHAAPAPDAPRDGAHRDGTAEAAAVVA